MRPLTIDQRPARTGGIEKRVQAPQGIRQPSSLEQRAIAGLMLLDVDEPLFLGAVSGRLELRFDRERAQAFEWIGLEQQAIAASVELDDRSDVRRHDARRA